MKTKPAIIPCTKGHDPLIYVATGKCVGCTEDDARSKPWPTRTREEAYTEGSSKYYTGKVCVNGHVTQRYVSSGICIGCSTMNAGKYQKKVRDKFRNGAEGLVSLEDLYVHPGDLETVRQLVEGIKQARALQGSI